MNGRTSKAFRRAFKRNMSRTLNAFRQKQNKEIKELSIIKRMVLSFNILFKKKDSFLGFVFI
ncbi:MAG: hypothetical protein ACRC4W_08575 [Treponemataceae bacterium]